MILIYEDDIWFTSWYLFSIWNFDLLSIWNLLIKYLRYYWNIFYLSFEMFYFVGYKLSFIFSSNWETLRLSLRFILFKVFKILFKRLISWFYDIMRFFYILPYTLELTDPRTCAHVVAGLRGWRDVMPLDPSSGPGR